MGAILPKLGLYFLCRLFPQHWWLIALVFLPGGLRYTIATTIATAKARREATYLRWRAGMPRAWKRWSRRVDLEATDLAEMRK